MKKLIKLFSHLTALFICFLLLPSCESTDICSSISKNLIGRIRTDDCLDFSAWSTHPWDTLYFISSNITPDEIEELIGIEYPFKIHYDPNKVLLFMKNGEIASRVCGRCSSIYFSNDLRKGGIVTISKQESCLKAKQQPSGEIFISR